MQSNTRTRILMTAAAIHDPLPIVAMATASIRFGRRRRPRRLLTVVPAQWRSFQTEGQAR